MVSSITGKSAGSTGFRFPIHPSNLAALLFPEWSYHLLINTLREYAGKLILGHGTNEPILSMACSTLPSLFLQDVGTEKLKIQLGYMKISESLRGTWLIEEFYLAESVLRQKKDQDEAEMMGSGSDYGIAYSLTCKGKLWK